MKVLFKGLVFFLPLFFLPGLSLIENRGGADLTGKAALLYLAGSALALHLAYDIFWRGRKFRYSLFDKVYALVLAAAFASSWLARDTHSAFWGRLGSLQSPFWVMVFLFLLYIWAKNNIALADIRAVFKVLTRAYILSVALVFIVLTAKLWPGYFTRALGSLTDVSVYLAVMNVLVFGLFINGVARTEFPRVCRFLLWPAWLCSWWFLMAFNSYISWVVMLTGFIWLWFTRNGYLKGRMNDVRGRWPRAVARVGSSWLPFLCLLIPAIFIFYNMTAEDGLSARRRVEQLQLGFKPSVSVVRAVVRANPLFGSGPDNFAYAYSRHRPTGLNDSPYWSIRFEHSYSMLTEKLLSLGIPGWFAWLFFMAAAVFYIFYFFRKAGGEEKQSGYLSVVSGVLLSLAAVCALYSANLALMFLFWVFLGLAHVFWREKPGIAGFKEYRPFPGGRIVLKRASYVALAALFAVFLAFTAKNTLSVYFYAQAQKTGADLESKIGGLDKALSLDPYRYQYDLMLLNIHKQLALAELGGEQGDEQVADALMNLAVNNSLSAVDKAPYSVAAAEAQAALYRDLYEYIPGVLSLAVESFTRAHELEPSNPVLLLEMARIEARAGGLDDAAGHLEQALELKPDLYDARLELVRIYNNTGRSQEALPVLDGLLEQRSDHELYYEQGRAYFNLDEYEKAEDSLRQALALKPLHSNALYSLALTLEELGRVEEASFYYKKVLDLNPGNEQLRERIERLERDAPA